MKSRFTKELKKGREETLCQKEFEKWLVENGYIEDEQACRKARESCFNEDLDQQSGKENYGN